MKIKSKEFVERVKKMKPLFDYEEVLPKIEKINIDTNKDFMIYSTWSNEHIVPYSYYNESVKEKKDISTYNIDFCSEDVIKHGIEVVPYMRLDGIEYKGIEEVLKKLIEISMV